MIAVMVEILGMMEVTKQDQADEEEGRIIQGKVRHVLHHRKHLRE